MSLKGAAHLPARAGSSFAAEKVRSDDDDEDEDEDDDLESQGEPNVFCNVYDIVPSVNKVFRCLGSEWGIYHTGVQVHDREYSYGGHSDSSTGVFCAKPKSAQGAVFHRQVPIGRVDLDPIEVRQQVAEVSRSWPGNTYDPFQRNCNHFADSLCVELTGKKAPKHINRFTKSAFVRGVFHRCVVPIGKCLERCYDYGGITYSNDDDAADEGTNTTEIGISGAKGINQILVEAATAQKLKANAKFKEGNYDQAREAYNKAFGYLKSMSRRTEEEDEVVAQAQAVRVALLLNLALCDLKAEAWTQAVRTCDEVLAQEPHSQKARFRRGIAQGHLGKHDPAISDFKAVLQAAEEEGDTATARDARREMSNVRKMIDAEKQKEKEVAKRMFGGGGGATTTTTTAVAPPAAVELGRRGAGQSDVDCGLGPLGPRASE